MPVELSKRTDNALVSLTKLAETAPVDLGDVSMQVDIAADFSYSMSGRYPDEVQEAVERGLGLVLTGLDPDGIVPIMMFHSDLVGGEDLTVDNYRGWVEDFTRNHSMGGTNYSPFLNRMLGYQTTSTGRFRKKLTTTGPDLEAEKDQPPNLHLIYTDGAPSHGDRDRIEQLLVGARQRPHFFQFIMLGTDQDAMDYLDHLNNGLSGPGVDNVGVTVYAQQSPTDDQAFYADVLREVLHDWLPAVRRDGITRR